MKLTGLLKRIWYGPPVVSTMEEIETGGAVIEGTALSPKQLLTSPLNGAGCIAYRYVATYRAPSRTKGWIERVLKEVEVYVPTFEMHIEGGRLTVLSPPSANFDREEHLKTVSQGGLNSLKAQEFLIRPTQRIRVGGRISKGKDGFVIKARTMVLVADDSGKLTPRERALQRRKKKQKKGPEKK